MLQLDHLSFHIDKDGEPFPLLDEVSLDIPTGHFMAIVDLLSGSLKRCLSAAGLSTTDIDVLACHQPSGWLLPALRETLELGAETVTPATFQQYGSVAACNVPLALLQASKSGAFNEGAIVALAAGGAGMTWSTAILRWST